MLQLRTIEPRTLELLKELCAEPILAHTFLVGGTSLAFDSNIAWETVKAFIINAVQSLE
jgi:hypothetical protein